MEDSGGQPARLIRGFRVQWNKMELNAKPKCPGYNPITSLFFQQSVCTAKVSVTFNPYVVRRSTAGFK
jgi:hypothetical protein